jgi:endonuclease YncB( thermonuclease family)
MILLLVKTLNCRFCPWFYYALICFSSLPLTADGLESESMSQMNVERSPTEQERGQNVLNGVITHVRDGDTIEVAQIPIRLAALDCPEVGSIAGDFAKSVAEEFLGSQAICFLTGAKSYDRFVAYCEIRGFDFGENLMRKTNCKVWKKFDVWNRY